MIDHVALKTKCYKALRGSVGDVQAEWFIHDIQIQKQDYTAWRQQHYDGMTDGDFQKAMHKHSDENPFIYDMAEEV